jgi:hypothetical protein
MELNLDRMLESVRDGQWSVDDFDWSQPLQGADHLSAKEKCEAGLMLLAVAGLERQAARIFDLASQHATDDRAAAIYRFFAADEKRHAEAETRLARRYGATEADLPLPTRAMLGVMGLQWRRKDRAVLHFETSAGIVFFELALDSLLIPALKEQVSDPVQAEVFRRIDIDESRHLAMDYWLIEQRGQAYANRNFSGFPADVLTAKSRADRARQALFLVPLAVTTLAGLGSLLVHAPSFRRALTADKIAKYQRRVGSIPRKAPHALASPFYRVAAQIPQGLARWGLAVRGESAPALT